MQRKYSVIIVDDHRFLSDGVAHLLSSTSLYNVEKEHISDGLQVYSACGRAQPDIVILDLGLPGMDGIDIIYHLKRRWPDLLIIVLTADTTEHRATEAHKAGASGYVLKQSPQHVLLSTIQKVVAGQICFDPSLSLFKSQDIDPSHSPVNHQLTMRERQILKLIAEGNRNRDISEKLHISIKTVETHRLNLMRKLDAHCVADLVSWANRLRITTI
ncbi:TPA: two component system response regulator [Pseudomonas aeruginosa]|nr:two component system response regulator [Pseudomonas aeruginosa]HEK1308596.1 two component system response regulator [Pseudomonas aeruginosa]